MKKSHWNRMVLREGASKVRRPVISKSNYQDDSSRFIKFVEPAKLNFTRIIGGTTPSSWLTSHMAFVITSYPNDVWGQCSGSILTRNLVLSAAHCFTPDGITDPIAVYVFIATNPVVSGVPYYIARRVAVHKQYNPATIQNDIALVEVFGSFQGTYKSVFLASSMNWLSGGQVVFAAGYGPDENGSSAELNEVELKQQPFELCVPKTIEALRPTLNNTQILCATGPGFPTEGGKDTCRGDSGGPLYVKLSTYYVVQIGITSFGGQQECALPDSVTWYTNVSSYIPSMVAFTRGYCQDWKYVIGGLL